ncbi:MAG TPA: BON domain-containing protein [Pirellulales bacterium]|nr:BON domain-containing protein [Pirellulales bacterium]
MPKDRPPDATISRNAIRQLANRGLRAPCRINVQTRNGQVTLTGHVQYPHQRDAAVQALRAIEGVDRVTDQLKVKPPAKHEYKTLPPLPKPDAAPIAAEAEATDAAAEEQAAEPDASHETDAHATAEPDVELTAEAAVASEANEAPEAAGNLSDSTEFDLGPLPPRASFSMPKSSPKSPGQRPAESDK